MTRKPRIGRPTSDNPLEISVNTRFTRQEYEHYQQVAKAEQRSMSDWIRLQVRKTTGWKP